MVGRFPGDVLHVVRQRLGVLRGARHGKRVHEAARAIAAVAVVQARGIPGKCEFRHAHGLFQAVPDARLFENLRAPGADVGPPAGQSGARAPARNGDVVGVQPFHRSVKIIAQHALLRRDLKCIGKRCVPFAQDLLQRDLHAAGGVAICRARGVQAIFQIVTQRPQQRFVGPGMQATNPVVFVLVFDQAQSPFSSLWVEDEHADVHPFVAQQVRNVAEKVICGAGLRGLWGCAVCGNLRHCSPPIISST